MKTATNHIGEFFSKLSKPLNSKRPRLAICLAAGFVVWLQSFSQSMAVPFPTSAWNFDVPSDRGKDLVDGRPLDIIGLPVTSFGPGLFGDAIIYDGNAAHRAQRPVNDTIVDLGASDFTMQVWVNFSSTAGEQVLLEKFDGPAGPGWTFYKGSGNTLELYGGSGGSHYLASGSLTINSGVWHQFIARRSGNTFNLFYDGSSVATANLPGAVAAASGSFPLVLGARTNDGLNYGGPISGRVDEVGFWNSALSNSDISSLWNGGAGLAVIPEPSTVAMVVVGGLLFLRRRHGE